MVSTHPISSQICKFASTSCSWKATATCEFLYVIAALRKERICMLPNNPMTLRCARHSTTLPQVAELSTMEYQK